MQKKFIRYIKNTYPITSKMSLIQAITLELLCIIFTLGAVAAFICLIIKTITSL